MIKVVIIDIKIICLVEITFIAFTYTDNDIIAFK